MPLTTKTKSELGIGTPITLSSEEYAKIKTLITPIREFYYGDYWLELTDADLQKIPATVRYRIEEDAFTIAGVDPLIEQPDIPAELQALEAGEDDKGLYLLQYVARSKNEWAQATKSGGIEELAYSGGTNYLVWATPNELKAAQEQFDFIRAVVPYHGKYKIEPRLLEQTGVIDWVNVKYYREDNGQKIVEAIKAMGGEVTHSGEWNTGDYNGGIIQTKIDVAKLSELAALPQVISLWKGSKEVNL